MRRGSHPYSTPAAVRIGSSSVLSRTSFETDSTSQASRKSIFVAPAFTYHPLSSGLARSDEGSSISTTDPPARARPANGVTRRPIYQSKSCSSLRTTLNSGKQENLSPSSLPPSPMSLSAASRSERTAAAATATASPRSSVETRRPREGRGGMTAIKSSGLPRRSPHHPGPPITGPPSPNLPPLPTTPKNSFEPLVSVSGLDAQALPSLTPQKYSFDTEELKLRAAMSTPSTSLAGRSSSGEDGDVSGRSGSRMSGRTSQSHLRVDVEGQSFFFATPPTGGSTSPEPDWGMLPPRAPRRSNEDSNIDSTDGRALASTIIGHSGHSVDTERRSYPLDSKDR